MSQGVSQSDTFSFETGSDIWIEAAKMFYISVSIGLRSDGPVKKALTLRGWKKGHQQPTYLSVPLTVKLSRVDLLCSSQEWPETEVSQRQRGKKGAKDGEREHVDKSTLFFFSFSFFSLRTFFFSRLFSFLTAAMCLISDVICSRPWAGARWGGEGLTLGQPPSSH